MAIKLITGLKEIEDIQSEDDGARVYATISNEDRVLNVGEKFGYKIISNNCIRIKSGEILMQGRHVRQTPGTYTDLTIDNGTQGQKRNDLIVLRYTKNSGTGIENAELAVIKGTPGSSAVDPEFTTGDIYAGCLLHEMPLYRVYLNGLSISSVTELFNKLSKFEGHNHTMSDVTGTLPISKGGTGATTASEALNKLGAAVYKSESNRDFNLMTTPGLYTMKNSSTNAPTSGTYHSLIVNKSDNGDYVQQLAIKESTTEMYIRYLSGSTWSAWKKFYTEGSTVPIANGGTGATTASDAVSNFKTAIVNLVYPIGSILMSVKNTNPSNYLGGTWVAWGAGRVPVGVNTSDSSFSTVEKTGGEKTHTLTSSEMPKHAHYTGVYTGNGSASHFAATGGDSLYSNTDTGQAGGSQAHNNLQPYITCYMWKRTA